MTKAEWQACANLPLLLAVLGGKTTARKRILFGCGYCRLLHGAFLERYPDLLVQLRTIERYAAGEVDEQEYIAATRARPWKLGALVRRGDPHPATVEMEGQAVLGWLRNPWATAKALAGQEAAPILRDVFWPFAKPALGNCLAWESGLVTRLAQAAYDERSQPTGTLEPARLAVLADALEEAGAEAELLDHLRAPAPHVCGCWPIDLILAKQ